MKNIVYTILALTLFTLWSCEDELDKFPQSKIPPESFFNNEAELQVFSNPFYTIFPATGIYSEAVDNVLNVTLPDEMRGARIIPGSGGGWSWTQLRDYNTLLQYSTNCKDVEVRERYNGLARFFRAYFYFEKVKRFGDVPWYEEPLGSADKELYKPRESREYVMSKMLEDLDYAIEKLPRKRELYRVTRWTALALKSRVCLFEGTFRKYHGLELEGHDWRFYLEQCAKASEEFITNSGYGLYTGDFSTAYRDVFASLDARPEEIVLARDYNASLGVTHEANFSTLGVSYGRPGLSKKVVNYYLMSDGSRFTDKPDYATMQFKDECTNRDPRLSQTIRTPGYTRIGTTEKLAPNLAHSVTGYHPVKFVMEPKYDANGKSENDLPIFRSAEVLLNFAEAKAELGTLTPSDINLSIKKLRDRVGMPNLDMAQANANPDPYLMSTETGYPNVTGENRGVILEIRRERGVELMKEGFRYYDIMRWKEGASFAKPLLGMYIPAPGAYDLDGNGSLDVEFYLSSATSAAPLKLKINQDIFFSGDTYGYISPHKNLQGSWNEQRDYLYPIPTDDRLLTKGALTQNPGWIDNLTF